MRRCVFGGMPRPFTHCSVQQPPPSGHEDVQGAGKATCSCGFKVAHLCGADHMKLC